MTPCQFDIILPTIGRPSMMNAIESVIDQTYKHWQLVVILDNCGIKVPNDIDPRVSFTPTSGLKDFGARARNTGIKRTHDKWVAYIDDDDVWLPHHLQTHVDIIRENPDVDMVRTAGQSFKMRHKHPRTSKKVRKLGPINTDDILTVGMSHTREIFNLTNGWQPCDNHDKLLWQTMQQLGGDAQVSEEITFEFRR